MSGAGSTPRQAPGQASDRALGLASDQAPGQASGQAPDQSSLPPGGGPRRRGLGLRGGPRRGVAVCFAFCLGLAATSSAGAQPQSPPSLPPPAAPAGPRVVALAPLATMGADDTSAVAQANAAALEKAIAALPATRAIGPAQVAQAIKRARKPGLAACDGELACVAELGKLAGATVVVTGQSGGLGEARVIYLRAIDTTSARELGSTTWTTGGSRGAGSGDSAAAAVTRLLTPAAYTGRLLLTLTVRDATVYINGKRLGPVGKPLAAPASPPPPPVAAAYAVAVGTHALRVTHPEYRDFVRFVDVSYGATTEVPVTLAPLPIVQRDLAARGRPVATTEPAVAPWYGRWWAVAGGAAALAVIAGVVTYSVSEGFDPDLTIP